MLAGGRRTQALLDVGGGVPLEGATGAVESGLSRRLLSVETKRAVILRGECWRW